MDRLSRSWIPLLSGIQTAELRRFAPRNDMWRVTLWDVRDEKKKGRFPSELEIVKVKLPHDLAARVAESQRIASEEVSPRE